MIFRIYMECSGCQRLVDPAAYPLPPSGQSCMSRARLESCLRGPSIRKACAKRGELEMTRKRGCGTEECKRQQTANFKTETYIII